MLPHGTWAECRGGTCVPGAVNLQVNRLLGGEEDLSVKPSA